MTAPSREAARALAAFRPLRRLVDRRARTCMAVMGLLRVVERLLLAAVALSFAKDRIESAVAVSGMLAATAALRAVARTPLLSVVRRRFTALATGVLLRRQLLASSHKREQSELVLFESLWAAEVVLADQIPGIVADGVAAVLLGGALAWALPGRLIVVGAVALVVAGLGADAARRVASRHAQRSWDAFLPVASSMEACLHGGAELVGNGRDLDQKARVRDDTLRWVRSAWRADWLAGLSGRVPILIGFAGVIVAILVEQSARGVTPSTALAEGLVVATALPPFASVLTNVVELSRAAPKLEPLTELLALDEPEDDDTGADEGRAPPLPAVVRWTSIDYRYPSDADDGDLVLSNLSGEWQPGRLLAVGGPNGAGKSTLFRLLLKFDAPQRGSLTVGEVSLAEIDARAWRRRIAYLPQRPFLPHGNVRDAIAFLAPDATDEAMSDALRRTGVFERLRSERPEAPLDVSVSDLSAGERQRVALARLLVQSADVYLLDEPDANLDAAGVRMLATLLRELASGQRMVAFIAHDEALLAAADRVVRLGGVEATADHRP